MSQIEVERIRTQLSAPDFRVKEGKCYDTTVVEKGVVTLVHNHLCTIFFGGKATGCQCGKIDDDVATKTLMEKAFDELQGTLSAVEEMGLIRKA